MADTQIDEWAFFAINERRAYERELLNERKRAEASVDARLEAEARLQEANEQLSLEHRRKDEFLATLAHELRNPLAPLRNVLEVIRLRQGDAPKELWGIDVIERQTRQLTHLVEDLMDVSRITQGRMQLRRKPCDLIAIVKAAVADLGSTIEAAGLRLALQLPGDLITVDADEVRLTQVISNLLTNAIKYTPAGGRIVLSVNAGDGEATLSICDTGIGIPAKALETVFTMFSQLTPALERSEGGLGIGLALVRGLVELHGGRISAASEGIGHGSTFTLVLPTLQAEAAPAPAPLASQLDQHLMILVVDDNADAADTLAMAIELLGHKVQVAYDARGALTLAAERRPDLILLDIGLPDMNGYEVAKRLRAEPWGQKLTLIAATGWGQDADRQRASDAGFDHHLVKPIEFNALIELLHHR
jgi:signal transduction histidine kinase